MGLCRVWLPPPCAALRYDVSSFVAPSIPTSRLQSMQDIHSVSRYGRCDTSFALFQKIELNKTQKEYDDYLLGLYKHRMGPRVRAVDVTGLLQRVSPCAVWLYSSCHVPPALSYFTFRHSQLGLGLLLQSLSSFK